MVDPRLVNYIKASLSRKIPVEQIKNSLSTKGWQDSDINEAINLVTQRRPIQQMPRQQPAQPIQQPQPQMPSQRRPVQPIQQPSQPISRKRPMSSQGFSPTKTMQEKPKETKPQINLIFIFVGIFALLLVGVIVFLVIRNASVISDEELSQGVSLNLKENKEIKFKIDDEQHSIKVNSVFSDSVSITVQSDPVSVTLGIGENKKFDFEQDGIFDLYIKLNDIIEGEADFLLKKIAEECIEDWNCTDWSDCENGEQIRECVDLNNCNTENDKPDEIQECEIVLSCSEQEGVVCSGTETCNGTITNSSEGDCCLGECVEIEAIACETDIDCFINASETCHPANLTYNISYSNSTWTEESKYYYEIRGLVDERCEMYEKIKEISGNFTSEEWTKLLELNYTTEQINTMVQERISIFNGISGICRYTIYSLEEHLKDIKDESFTFFSDSEIDEYQCTGDLYMS